MDTLLTPVSYYGLHYTPEGVAFLHQGRSAANFIGLKSQSPFEVKQAKNKACPHIINTASPVPDRAHWDLFLRLVRDPLVEIMLPIPKERQNLIPFISDPNNELAMDLVILSRLSSPIYQVVHPFEKFTQKQLIEELSLTNIAPLVLTGILPEHTNNVMAIAKEARLLPRKLILTGDPTIPITAPLYRLQTTIWDFDDLTLAGLPMESLGAAALRRYARGEQIDTPYPRKD